MSASATSLDRGRPDADAASRPLAEAHAQLDLVTTRDDFDALERDWNDLFARAGRDTQLFQTFNWLWHWANHFLPREDTGRGPELAIVTARFDGRLVLAWPLVKERHGPIVRLTWMGEPVSQYGDLIVDDAVADPNTLIEAAWDFAVAQTGASVLHLRKVREDAVIAPVLALRKAKVVGELVAPYLDLSGAENFAEYEKRYSSGARRNRKRQRRRLEERGPVTLEVERGGVAAQALTITAFKLKLEWLAQRGLISPALSDPRTLRFFVDATGSMDRPAGCHVLALKCAEQPVALEIGLTCKGRSAIHIIVYDAAFEKTAAGSLLMEDSIRRAVEQRLTVFDLLAPDAPYKREWADATKVVRDWAAPNSLAGRAYAAVYLGVLRNTVKKGLDHLPVGMRRRITKVAQRFLAQKE
jgi:CelD/BcsL family acetyltransferase involved in cellulose biosynthesis